MAHDKNGNEIDDEILEAVRRATRKLHEQLDEARAALGVQPSPIPVIIHCPECGMRHVDEGEFANKPHKTHTCQGCGFNWAPALVPTVGVQFLPGCNSATDLDVDMRKSLYRLWRAAHRIAYRQLASTSRTQREADDWEAFYAAMHGAWSALSMCGKPTLLGHCTRQKGHPEGQCADWGAMEQERAEAARTDKGAPKPYEPQPIAKTGNSCGEPGCSDGASHKFCPEHMKRIHETIEAAGTSIAEVMRGHR